jgi:2-amino-4-hydroxy-6-hydroxymethyldihydropteridine diphosphokinase
MPFALALGSNLPSPAGGPRQTLDAALLRLQDLGKVTAVSRYCETAPVGYADQPAFLNAAAVLETTLTPQALLTRLLAIERDFGRDRSHGIPNGPRTLDLDILLCDDLVLDTPTLQLPHPRMHQRSFVLIPLAEIAPTLIHPVLQESMAQLLQHLTLPLDQTNKSGCPTFRF